jgi:hypothetical protein
MMPAVYNRDASKNWQATYKFEVFRTFCRLRLIDLADNSVLFGRCQLGELIIKIAGRDHEAGIDG